MTSTDKFFTSFQNNCLNKFNLLNVKELREVLLNSGIIEINNIPIEKIPKEKICKLLYDEHINLPVTLKNNLNMNYVNKKQHGGVHYFDYELEDVVFVHMTTPYSLIQILNSGKIDVRDAYVGKGVFTVPSIPDLETRKFFTSYGFVGIVIKCSDWTKYTTEVEIEPHETSVDEAFEKMLKHEERVGKYLNKSYFFDEEEKLMYPEIPIKNYPKDFVNTHTTEIVFLQDVPLSDIICVFVTCTLMSHKECMEQMKDLIMPMIKPDVFEYIYEKMAVYNKAEINKDKDKIIIKNILDTFEQLFLSNENNFDDLLEKAFNYINTLFNNAFMINQKIKFDDIIMEDINILYNMMSEFKEKFYLRPTYKLNGELRKDPSCLYDETKLEIKQLCEEHNIPLYDNVFCHEDLHRYLS